MKERIKDIIGNNFICKLFFVLIPFLNEIPMLTPHFNPMMKFGLVIGAIYILYDLFHNRNILKTPCIVPAVALILCLCIGTAIHFRSEQLRMNLIETAFTIVSLLVLFSPGKAGKEYKELSIINYILVFLTTVASAFSIYLFFAGVSRTFVFHDYSYSIGVFNGRLVGIFRNSIYPTAAIAVFCAFIQIFINKTVLEKKRYWPNILLIISIVINTEVFVLQNSKGIFISFAGAILVFFLCVVYRFLSAKQAQPRTLLNGAAGFGIGGAAVGISYGMLTLTRELNFFIAELIEKLKAQKPQLPQIPTPMPPTNPIFTDRVVDERYGFMTGRPYVWKTGLQKALEQPLFGYGPYTLTNDIHPFPGSTEQLSHFHNIFVHTLVSGGILGLIAFTTLTVYCVCRLLKVLFTQTQRKDYLPFLAICALLVFIFISNMADTTILYMTKQSGFIFFIFLGYAMTLCNTEKTFKVDFPARWLDSLLSKNKKAGD